jgi:hypothetical protein
MAKKAEKEMHEVHEDVIESEDFDVTTDEGEIKHDENGLPYRGEKKGTDGCTIVYR